MARETINGISVPVPGTGEPADFQGDLRRFATDLSASIDGRVGTTIAPLREYDMLTEGATADGVADDWAAFTSARTKAGAKGIVHFPAKPGAAATTYHFATATAGANPDLSGTNITADPGVTISVAGVAYVDYSSWKLLSPVTIYVRDRTASIAQRPNTAADPNVRLANGDIEHDYSTRVAEDFATWEKRDYFPDGGPGTYAPTAGAGTATSARQFTMPTTVVSNHAGGPFTAIAPGEAVRVAVHVATSAATGAILAHVQAADEYVQWAIPDNSSTLGSVTRRRRRSTEDARTLEKTIALPTRAYSTQSAANMQVEVKRTGLREAELYINGWLVDRATFTSDVQDAGVLSSSGYNPGGVVLYDPVRIKRARPSGGKTLRLCILGDSNSFGAAQSTPYPAMLRDLLRGAPGVTDVSVTNLAVSGHGVADTLSIANAQDFSTYDYVLVLIGTNDIQSQTAIATFQTNLAAVGTAITGDGSVPIFGIPTMFIAQNLTGYGFVTSNYALGARYRSAIEYLCATQGYEVADLMAEFGKVGTDVTTLYDNLHFNVLGAQAAARSFAKAVLRRLRSHYAPKFASVRADAIEGSGGVMHYPGITGTPEGALAAPVGSTATRRDGGTGTTYYVKESGAGKTGWVAK